MSATTTPGEAYLALERSIGSVAPEADLAAVPPTASLREWLDLDSMDFLSVVEHVAALTGVTVPESQYLTVDSVDGFVRYIEEHRQS